MARMGKTHPGLFLGILGIALVHLSEGLIGLFKPVQPQTVCIVRNSDMPRLVSIIFTIPFLVIGVLLLLGLFFLSYKLIQRTLIFGFMYVMFYVFALVPAFAFSLDKPETWLFIGLMPPFVYWGFTHFIAIKEPPENPATQKTKERIDER